MPLLISAFLNPKWLYLCAHLIIEVVILLVANRLHALISMESISHSCFSFARYSSEYSASIVLVISFIACDWTLLLHLETSEMFDVCHVWSFLYFSLAALAVFLHCFIKCDIGFSCLVPWPFRCPLTNCTIASYLIFFWTFLICAVYAPTLCAQSFIFRFWFAILLCTFCYQSQFLSFQHQCAILDALMPLLIPEAQSILLQNIIV